MQLKNIKTHQNIHINTNNKNLYKQILTFTHAQTKTNTYTHTYAKKKTFPYPSIFYFENFYMDNTPKYL
jgi:hypothetical protein